MDQKVSATITIPDLAEGEINLGLLFEGAKPKHWVILLPGDKEGSHEEMKEFAEKAGGELPTRKEQALAFANGAEHFEEDYYWSLEQPAGRSGYAWCQTFGDGGQDWGHRSTPCRARAVRRVPVQ